MLVHQLNIEKVSFWSRVLPPSDFAFLGHSCFDPPVIVEGRERFYWSIGLLLKLFLYFWSTLITWIFLRCTAHLDVLRHVTINNASILSISVLGKDIFWYSDILCTRITKSIFFQRLIIFWHTNANITILIDDFWRPTEDKDDTILYRLLDKSEELYYTILWYLLTIHFVKNLFIHHCKDCGFTIRKCESHLYLFLLILAFLLLRFSIKYLHIYHLKEKTLLF